MKKDMHKLLCCGLLGLAVMAVPAWADDQMPPEPPETGLHKIGEEAEGTLFAKSIEDLPLMKGLEIVEDKDLVFIFGDKRIAQTTLKGRVDIDSVYYFYHKILPSLGWKPVTKRLYVRNGEQLRMDASAANNEGLTYVRFGVEPAEKKKK